MKLKKKYINYSILILLLIFTFFRTYSLHLNHRFPYHHDEWQHLALSIQAIEEGYNKQHNPYLNEPNNNADLEPGFHLYLSSFFLITNLDPILTYQYFAAVFAVISGFVIFLCCYRLSKKFFVGILSLIVFISLPTNVNILGKDFFIPLTMAIPFIFLYILFFLESLKEKDTKKFVFSLFILILLFFVHPPSFVILLFPSIIEVLFNLKNVKKIYSTIPKYTLFLVFLLFLVSTFLLSWKGTISATKNYVLDLLFFEQGWGKLEAPYIFPLWYGRINTLFAVLGFAVTLLISLKMIKGKKNNLLFFVVLSFFSLGLTAFFNVFGFSILVPYQRALHYAMFGLLPLTAYGVYITISYVTKILNLKNHRVITSLLFLLFFFIVMNSQNEKKLMYEIMTTDDFTYYEENVITEYDYETLLWIKDNLGEDNILVTPYFMTSATYPISKNQVISIIPAQLEGGLREENLNFFNYDCDKQKEIIDKSKAEYIISRIKLSCDYLEEVYSNNLWIYQIKSTK